MCSNTPQNRYPEAGSDAIRHIIDRRIKTNKNRFIRIDEDKHVAFVVPQITWCPIKQNGSLNNDHWHYNVGFGFREALDLLYIERIRNKRKVRLWTQGPNIAFKEGDFIESRDKNKAIQVIYADAMGWDTTKNNMFYGSVTYKVYERSINGLAVTKQNTATQLEFLEILIGG
ncbi:hypothetical protein [Vibrio maritimus]|uniref:hypothetical protein n=1 Tax=Vibrio maritimus TaxID=990268 RepID=UPI001F2F69DC|nr:hypothetical protein [Vibrio maritimus]